MLHGFGLNSEVAVLGLLGLGLYAQSNDISLANNTSILLMLFLLFLEHEQIEELQRSVRLEERRCDGGGGIPFGFQRNNIRRFSGFNDCCCC